MRLPVKRIRPVLPNAIKSLHGKGKRCFSRYVPKREKVEIPVTVRFTRAQLDAVEAAAEALGIERAQFYPHGRAPRMRLEAGRAAPDAPGFTEKIGPLNSAIDDSGKIL